MKCLLLFGRKIACCHKLPWDSFRIISDLVAHPAAALCSLPLARLSRESVFFISEDHKNILCISILDVYSPGSLTVNPQMMTDDNKRRKTLWRKKKKTLWKHWMFFFWKFGSFLIDWSWNCIIHDKSVFFFFSNQWLIGANIKLMMH